MGMISKALQIAQAKVNTLLNKLEDPNESLDLSYDKMMSGLQEIKVHLTDVVTEQKRIENSIADENANIEKFQEQAKAAVAMGKDDLAREALGLKQKSVVRIANLKQQLDVISKNVESLKAAEQKFKTRLEQFRDEKEFTKAQYTAQKNVADVNASLAGLSDDLGGVGRAMEQAKDKTQEMKARSEAVDQLSDEGILNDPLDTKSSTEKQLDDIQNQKSIEDELAALKKSN